MSPRHREVPTPIELLIEVRDALPIGHAEKPGLIRAVELLRSLERTPHLYTETGLPEPPKPPMSE